MQLLLVNPIKDRKRGGKKRATIKKVATGAVGGTRSTSKRGRRSMAKKKRSAAQKAATKRMIAARKRTHLVPAATAVKKRKKRRSLSHAKRNPIVRTSRGNTFSRKGATLNIVNDYVVPVGAASGAALAVDVAVGMLPVSQDIKVGPYSPIVKALLGLGIGMAVSLVSKPIGRAIGMGALIIGAHNAAKMALNTAKPGMLLGEWGDDVPPGTSVDGYATDLGLGESTDNMGGGDDIYNMDGVSTDNMGGYSENLFSETTEQDDY